MDPERGRKAAVNVAHKLPTVRSGRQDVRTANTSVRPENQAKSGQIRANSTGRQRIRLTWKQKCPRTAGTAGGVAPETKPPARASGYWPDPRQKLTNFGSLDRRRQQWPI